MSESYLSIRDLVVEYSSGGEKVQAVNGIDLDLQKGETIGLVGETGAGKTTIAKSILRILPTPPAKIISGQVKLDGTNLLEIPEHEMQKIRGNKIAMIFQDPMTALNPTMTVGEQINEVVLRHNHISREEATKRTIEMLEMVGIASVRFHDYPHQFSGGMKQRVVIAIAMICNPELIICDEPTTALDVTIQAQIMELLKSLQVNEGKSIILITHNMGLVAEMADEVCVMYMGRVVEFGSLEDIFDHTSHPYTKALLRSVPVLGLGDDQKLETIPGVTPNPADLKEGCEFADRCSECMEKCRKGKIPAFEVSPGHKVRCLKFDSYPEVK